MSLAYVIHVDLKGLSTNKRTNDRTTKHLFVYLKHFSVRFQREREKCVTGRYSYNMCVSGCVFVLAIASAIILKTETDNIK